MKCIREQIVADHRLSCMFRLLCTREKCRGENEAVFFHRVPSELPPLPEGKPLAAALQYEGPRLAAEEARALGREAEADADQAGEGGGEGGAELG